MRFIYKINSSYDGFTPSKSPKRLKSGRRIRLGWNHYIDVVDRNHEVWVYFHGPHAFLPASTQKVSSRRLTRAPKK
jgi:hypothetical protein